MLDPIDRIFERTAEITVEAVPVGAGRKASRPAARASTASQGMATVTSIVDVPAAAIVLDAVDGPARRAASCLVAPAPGDRVWFVRQGGACFVTAVLERAAPDAPMPIVLEGDVEVAAEGSLSLSGCAVAVVAEETMQVQSASLSVRSGQAEAVLGEVATFAKSMVSHIASATWIGSKLEQLVDHWAVHSRTASRTVAGLDQLQARDIDHRATGSATLCADHTFLQGHSMVKADGGQIHLG
ncbi:MAG: DUF3540 domain-containing protein [Myxococcota bacterium]